MKENTNRVFFCFKMQGLRVRKVIVAECRRTTAAYAAHDLERRISLRKANKQTKNLEP